MVITFEKLIRLLCPVCGKGKIFKGYLDTPDRCPECGFFFMRETGYFLPHAPISYLFIVLSAFVTWIVVQFGLGLESDSVILALMIGCGVAFGFWSNRYTKMIWMAIDLTLHPPTKEDFEPRGRE